jgi:hypothetical protein
MQDDRANGNGAANENRDNQRKRRHLASLARLAVAVRNGGKGICEPLRIRLLEFIVGHGYSSPRFRRTKYF